MLVRIIQDQGKMETMEAELEHGIYVLGSKGWRFSEINKNANVKD